MLHLHTLRALPHKEHSCVWHLAYCGLDRHTNLQPSGNLYCGKITTELNVGPALIPVPTLAPRCGPPLIRGDLSIAPH